MGKKSKASLEIEKTSEDELQSQKEVEELERPIYPADDDALIPYHTKQAGFALLYLLFFSCLMFTLPFASFYGVRHALHDYFQIDGFQNTAWSVLAAVVTVNFVIALYAIFGFMEAKREEEKVLQFANTKAKTN